MREQAIQDNQADSLARSDVFEHQTKALEEHACVVPRRRCRWTRLAGLLGLSLSSLTEVSMHVAAHRLRVVAATMLVTTVLAVAPLHATTTPVGIAAFGVGSTLTTFTGIPNGTEVNGLTVDGIQFTYSLGNGQAIIDGGPGVTNNINPPNVVSIGNPTGILRLTLPSFVDTFGYGYAILNGGAVANATTINLFNGATNVGSLSYNGVPDPTFTGGFAGIQSTIPFNIVQVTFNSAAAPAFALDNIRTFTAQGTSFDMVHAQATCLLHARGQVRVTSVGPVEEMDVDVSGLPPNTDFDFFVIQVPKAPFGLAWYQGDIETDDQGKGHQRFIGRFSIETFIVAPGIAPAPVVHDQPPFPDASSNPMTAPVHTFHLGLWFNSPKDAVAAGCPGATTPFNGDHTAGVQVLNTSNFPDDQGPLRQIP